MIAHARVKESSLPKAMPDALNQGNTFLLLKSPGTMETPDQVNILHKAVALRVHDPVCS